MVSPLHTKIVASFVGQKPLDFASQCMKVDDWPWWYMPITGDCVYIYIYIYIYMSITGDGGICL